MVNKTRTKGILMSVCALITLVSVVFCSYGYAAMSTDLLVSGVATVIGPEDFGIGYMQEMTAAICNRVATHTTQQLKDRRDNKSYWVTKMADGNCWMTQNLALNLSTSATLTSIYSAVTSSFRPTKNSATSITTSTLIAEAAGVGSWNFSNYLIVNPTATTSCGYNKNSPADCPAQVIEVGNRKPSSNPNFYNDNGATYTATEYDAHYLLGYYYQFNAVTGGTGGALNTGLTTSSICPKGWIIPGSSSGDSGNMSAMLTKEGATKTFTLPPYALIRTGYVRQHSSFLYSALGSDVYYWASRAQNSTAAWAFRAVSSNFTTTTPEKSYGLTVRCVFVAN